jgi:hypothetical protein
MENEVDDFTMISPKSKIQLRSAVVVGGDRHDDYNEPQPV